MRRVGLLLLGCAGLSAAAVISCYEMTNALWTSEVIGTKTACYSTANKFCETYVTFVANRVIAAKKKCAATCVDGTNNFLGAGSQRLCCATDNCNDKTYKSGQKFSVTPSPAAVTKCYTTSTAEALSTTETKGTATSCQSPANNFCETSLIFLFNRIFSVTKKCVATCVDHSTIYHPANRATTGMQRTCCSTNSCNKVSYKIGQNFSALACHVTGVSTSVAGVQGQSEYCVKPDGSPFTSPKCQTTIAYASERVASVSKACVEDGETNCPAGPADSPAKLCCAGDDCNRATYFVGAARGHETAKPLQIVSSTQRRGFMTEQTCGLGMLLIMILATVFVSIVHRRVSAKAKCGENDVL